MAKERSITLTVPQPCHEDWDKMTPNERGRHCASCNKTVIDFSLYSDRELVEFFKNASGRVCGRLNNWQANREIIISDTHRSPFYKWFLGTALASWLGLAGTASAQSNKTKPPVSQTDNKTNIPSTTFDTIKGQSTVGNQTNDTLNPNLLVGVIVEKMPTFKGDLQKYLRGHLTYPKDASDKGISGTVYLTFFVEKDGSITGVKILRGIYPSLDSEAVNVVRNMPKWKPGEQSGKPIRIQMNLPIHFSLDDAKSPK